MKNKAKIKPKEITKKMSFSEILEKNPEAIEILLKHGMHCIGCPMSQMESLEEGAVAHGLDADKLVEEINTTLLKKGLTQNKK